MTQPTATEAKLLDKNNNPQIANQQAAITAPVGGGVVDTEARTAINDLISLVEAHGLALDN